MKKKETDLLLIFTRNPGLGKCKTRLAAKIGDSAALEVYTFLLHHTVAFTQSLDAHKIVYYSEEIWENDIWDNGLYQKQLQIGNDLGKRMKNAFAQGFDSGFKKIIIIGSDMYDLSQSDLEVAFSKLDSHDYVIGPAEDGGYYLLGMKVENSKVFQDKAWGTKSVLGDTLKNLEKESLFVLPEKNDVDHYEDIKDIEAFQPFLKHMTND
ncbi:TIGR04282 family arsenosugar biosynthesis glycosyltransferase [Flagellimonas sp.]|uniref:TIGR04282 family arsenosugar biosynthesis glycosyltransferase n=1 Tax=Flagellimonas sp. TaxID=2058762 RepID=UPI003F4A6F28